MSFRTSGPETRRAASGCRPCKLASLEVSQHHPSHGCWPYCLAVVLRCGKPLATSAHSGAARRRPQPLGRHHLAACAGRQASAQIVVTDIPVAPSFQLEAIDAEHRLGCAGPQASQRMVGLLTVGGDRRSGTTGWRRLFGQVDDRRLDALVHVVFLRQGKLREDGVDVLLDGPLGEEEIGCDG